MLMLVTKSYESIFFKICVNLFYPCYQRSIEVNIVYV